MNKNLWGVVLKDPGLNRVKFQYENLIIRKTVPDLPSTGLLTHQGFDLAGSVLGQ